MSIDRSIVRTLLVCALAAAPGIASAADMGPVSRETVSISITVAPHVIVTPAAGTFQASSAGPTLCVGTNGFSQYHLALIRHSAGAEDEELLQSGGGRSGAACPGASPVMPQMLAGLETSSPGPVTLLIIPD